MNREILFRGKSLDGYWFKSMTIRSYKSDLYEFLSYWEWVTIEPETVGQYTGLKDTNGVKIFEGDIAGLYGKNYKVEMIGAQWMLSGYDYEIMSLWAHNSRVEVIGNIHDNPELLEQ